VSATNLWSEASHASACADVIHGCPATFEADTPEELMAQVAAHANAVHAGEPGTGCDVADEAVNET
jgi:predicted small metal-binding protein